MTTALNAKLFAGFDLFTFAGELVDIPTGAEMVDKLVGTGFSQEQIKTIELVALDILGQAVEGAFLAGYMTGRDPDLLVLGDNARNRQS